MSATDSPWLKVNSREAGAYARQSGRALRKKVAEGKLRAARIGGRGELLTTRAWLDEMIEADSLPVVVAARRRAG